MTALSRLWRISWRNIFRNKRRTSLTVLVLILGTTGLILVGGFFKGQLDRLAEGYIYSQSGHFILNKKGFFDQGEIDPSAYLLNQIGKLENEIAKNPHVKFIAPRLFSEGMLSNDNSSISVLAMGVVPSREALMFSRRYYDGATSMNLTEGEQLSPEDPYGILVGDPLQKSMGLKVGDSVTFITQRKGGSIDGADFHVRGIFQTTIREVGERSVKLNLSTLQELLNAPEGAHSLLVFLDEKSHTDQVVADLGKKLNANGRYFELIPWYAQGNLHKQTEGYLTGIFRVVEAIIAIIFFLSIANTINMALLERMREYGTMMAMGNSRRTLFQMIMMESFFLGLVGSLLGVGLGIVLTQAISHLGIPLPPPPLVSDTYLAMTITFKTSAGLLIQAWALTFLATLISAVLPAYRACHTRIVQALGYT